jgi:hypothetical protein
VPDAPRAEHRVELRLLGGVGVRVGERGLEADPVQRLLRDAANLVGWGDAEQVVIVGVTSQTLT